MNLFSNFDWGTRENEEHDFSLVLICKVHGVNFYSKIYISMQSWVPKHVFLYTMTID